MTGTLTTPARAGIVVGLASLIWLGGCSRSADDAPPTEPSSQTGVHFLNMDPDVEYVGEKVCRECHLEEYGTSQKTGMGRAFYPMSADDIVEDFTTGNEFVVVPPD